MRRAAWIPLLLLALLLCPAPQGACAAASADPLLLYGVQPNGACEWVTLFNSGDAAVDLSDYVLHDGEGTVTFDAGVAVPAGTGITVFSSDPPGWAPGGPSVVNGDGARFSNFRLADRGDQAMLLRGGAVVDAFVYGDAEACGGWVGEPFPRIPKNRYAERHSPTDTDSAADWRIAVPGRGDFDLGVAFDADVAPFSFPESGGEPVAMAVAMAEREILISTYVFSHPGIAALIEDALYRGVAVSILVEGSPAGGIPEGSLPVLRTLEDSGAEVLLTGREDGFRRFQYVHCKYAVVDGRYVVVSSENWTVPSFTKNRGWGVVVDSEGFAGLMREVHLSDSSPIGGDVTPLRVAHPKARPATLEPWPPFAADLEWFPATVEPVLSPDNSLDAMEAFVASARERVYSQQMSFSRGWMVSPGSPAEWMSAASSAGADARLIVDDSFGDGDGFSLRESAMAMEGLGIGMRFSPRQEGGGINHNKGIVSDGSVWVGSVNWTRNSLLNNREAAVIVHSREVSDYFAELFLGDWDEGIGPEGLVRVEFSGEMEAGSPFSLRLAGGGDAECLWDVGGRVFVGNPIVLRLEAGEYECFVAAGSSDIVRFTLRVAETRGAAVDPLWAFVPVGAASLVALLFKRKGRIGG